MIPSTRRPLIALTVGLLLGWTAHGGFNGILAQRRTPFMVTRIFTGPDWHPVNSRRYVVGVSSRREIEVADGKKITLGPGSVSLVEDLTGKGHLTRTVGTEDAITLIISLAASK